MREVLKPDLCVIGAGSAGLSVAAIAASFGVPVVLIEEDAMGGDCLNVGCVPSKALIAAADRRQAIRGRPPLRHRSRAGRIRGRLRRRPRAHPGRDRGDRAERFRRALHRDGGAGRAGGGALHRSRDGRGRRPDVRARRFVVATGSRPALPPIPGLEAVPLSHQRDRLRPRREAPPSHRRRAAARSGSRSPRPTGASAPT